MSKISGYGCSMVEVTKPDWWTSDHWSTPPKLVTAMESEFGRFDLDPCCRPETAKAEKFYTQVDDGLSNPWNGKIWLNPPYSNPAPWLKKAIQETESGRASIVVALLPSCTDTNWFHAYVLGRSEVRYMRGRITFCDWNGKPSGRSRFASMLAIYRGKP